VCFNSFLLIQLLTPSPNHPSRLLRFSSSLHKLLQIISGNVYFHLGFELPIRGVRITLLGAEYALGTTGGEGRYADMQEQTHVIVNESQQLTGHVPLSIKEMAQELVESVTTKGGKSPSHLHESFKAGEYSWPFEFRMSDNAPPDFASRYGSSISYSLVVNVDVPFSTDISTTLPLTVGSEINDDIASRLVDGKHCVSATAKKEFLFDHHPLSLHVELPSDTFYVGQVIDRISLDIHNTSSKSVRRIRISLWQKETVKIEEDEFEHTVLLASSFCGLRVDPHRQCATRTQFGVPHGLYGSIASAKLLSVSHFLRFTVDIPWALDLNLDMPIHLVEQPNSRSAATQSNSRRLPQPRALRSNL
jgi:Arrestin (or S-antigen), C-terminal domain/Arrestin (or S-antigen), N-terminal domain